MITFTSRIDWINNVTMVVIVIMATVATAGSGVMAAAGNVGGVTWVADRRRCALHTHRAGSQAHRAALTTFLQTEQSNL